MAAQYATIRQESKEELEETAESLLGEVDSAQRPPWQRRSVFAITTGAGLLTMAAAAALYGPPSTLLQAQPASGATELFRKREPLTKRKGSFIVIGDWGWDDAVHGNTASRTCQQTIAEKMAEKQRELGDVKFVVNVGDSFYPDGVTSKDDPQWQTKWRDVYDEPLRSIPWYSVYGNHDYHHDPCAWSDDEAACAQVNADVNDLSRFYMPSLNWFKEHPELELEVVAMDLNTVGAADCQYSQNPQKCRELLQVRTEEGFKLFLERAQSSSAKNLLVFSHYPTDFIQWRPDVLSALSNNSQHHIEYFGGHRHGVDQTSTVSTAPNNNWVVGGGGGWGCDGDMGFVVGEIGEDDTIKTYSVLVDPAVCCTR